MEEPNKLFICSTGIPGTVSANNNCWHITGFHAENAHRQGFGDGFTEVNTKNNADNKSVTRSY